MALKKYILAATVIAALGFASASFAAYSMPSAPPTVEPYHNWYIGTFGGITFTPDTTLAGLKTQYDTSWDIGGKIGYRQAPLRYEIEYIYQKTDIRNFISPAALRTSANGSVQVSAGMANILYDFAGGYQLIPYIGVGIGYANVKHAGRSSDDTFGMQAMAGLTTHASENMDIGLGYRYFVTSRASKSLGESFQNHIVNGEIIYHIF